MISLEEFTFLEKLEKFLLEEVEPKIDNAIIDNNAHTKFSPDITDLLLLKLTAHNTGLLQAGGAVRKETS